jgi:hypothetical protein
MLVGTWAVLAQWVGLAACATATSGAGAATPVQTHGWDTVADVMGMHGKYRPGASPGDAAVQFAAENYAFVTTGVQCYRAGELNHSYEDDALATALRLKQVKPSLSVGMYTRSANVIEIAVCSSYTPEWKKNAYAFSVKNASGHVVGSPPYLDFSNPDAAAFWVKAHHNVTTHKLPANIGDGPVFDYIYVDQLGLNPIKGVSDAHNAVLLKAKQAAIAALQAAVTANGYGQRVILNSCDSVANAAWDQATDVSAAMFDHWSILQFLNRSSGDFNVDKMDEAFTMVTNGSFGDLGLQIKGWPGPIIQQRDVYPRPMVSPSTTKEKQRISGERFNSELALFLLVASPQHFWVYSWFWDFDDYIPGLPDSTVPEVFFPETKCALGAPKGNYVRTGTVVYTREFEHASVYVNLANRTASHVDFVGCNL